MQKLYVLLLLSLTLGTVYAGGDYSTFLCVENKTNFNQHLTVTAINDLDWHDDSQDRPDRNFNDIDIAPQQTVCQAELVYAEGKHDGKVDFTFMVNGIETDMRYSTGHAVWESKDGTKLVASGGSSYDEGYTTGATCSLGDHCNGFHITW